MLLLLCLSRPKPCPKSQNSAPCSSKAVFSRRFYRKFYHKLGSTANWLLVGYSFPRSGVGTHIGTLRRPVNLAAHPCPVLPRLPRQCVSTYGFTARDPSARDAGASSSRSHAGAWERARRGPLTPYFHLPHPALLLVPTLRRGNAYRDAPASRQPRRAPMSCPPSSSATMRFHIRLHSARPLCTGRGSVLQAFPRRSVGTSAEGSAHPVFPSSPSRFATRSHAPAWERISGRSGVPSTPPHTHVLSSPVFRDNAFPHTASQRATPLHGTRERPSGVPTPERGNEPGGVRSPRISIFPIPLCYSFPSSGVGTHIGTLRRPVNPAAHPCPVLPRLPRQCVSTYGFTARDPSARDAGASSSRSHAGAWERARRGPLTQSPHLPYSPSPHLPYSAPPPASLPAIRPNTMHSTRAHPPRRSAPWIPPQTSPAANSPGIGLPLISRTLAFSSMPSPPGV